MAGMQGGMFLQPAGLVVAATGALRSSVLGWDHPCCPTDPSVGRGAAHSDPFLVVPDGPSPGHTVVVCPLLRVVAAVSRTPAVAPPHVECAVGVGPFSAHAHRPPLVLLDIGWWAGHQSLLLLRKTPFATVGAVQVAAIPDRGPSCEVLHGFPVDRGVHLPPFAAVSSPPLDSSQRLVWHAWHRAHPFVVPCCNEQASVVDWVMGDCSPIWRDSVDGAHSSSAVESGGVLGHANGISNRICADSHILRSSTRRSHVVAGVPRVPFVGATGLFLVGVGSRAPFCFRVPVHVVGGCPVHGARRIGIAIASSSSGDCSRYVQGACKSGMRISPSGEGCHPSGCCEDDPPRRAVPPSAGDPPPASGGGHALVASAGPPERPGGQWQ